MSENNPFAVAASQAGVVQVAQSKEAQQIQAQLVIAKKYPRDQHAAYQEIMKACQRKGLAEEASYLYSRGGTQITGASIRLLEVIAQNWGNFRSGVIELDQEDGESRMEAFAWDFQTNVYDSKTFTVRHERSLKGGDVVKLTDSRDVYEHTANFAARRKRACMEAVIPRDIVEDALEQCEKTLKSGHNEPITDRVRKMATAFAEYGVTVEMIEKRLQHKLDACIEQELVLLRKIYTSMKDGMSKREDWFTVTAEVRQPKFDDTAAESEAGLAPVQPTPKQPKAKPAPKTEPAPTPEPPAPTPVPAAEPEPEPTQTQPPADNLFADPEAQSDAGPVQETPYDVAVALMERDKITEAEVMALLKRKKFTAETTEELMQVADRVLIDMAKNWPMVGAQIRIDRKKAK